MGGVLVMAKRKGSPAQKTEQEKEEKKSRPQVPLDPELHRKLKLVCADAGVDMQDFVHDLLQPHVEREYRVRFPGRE